MIIHDYITKSKVERTSNYIRLYFLDLNKKEMFMYKHFICDDVSNGISLIDTSITIEDYKSLLEKLFSEFDIDDMQNQRVGMPDFKLKHKRLDIEFYIEIKAIDDGIRLPQLKWFIENKDREIIYLFIDERICNNSDKERPSTNEEFLNRHKDIQCVL
jgi:hypothetical protein